MPCWPSSILLLLRLDGDLSKLLTEIGLLRQQLLLLHQRNQRLLVRFDISLPDGDRFLITHPDLFGNLRKEQEKHEGTGRYRRMRVDINSSMPAAMIHACTCVAPLTCVNNLKS